jgi:hypothetical protein
MIREDYLIYIDVDGIAIGDRREVDPATVKKLAQSIKDIGLQHPITVRKVNDQNVLVAGRHRLEAVRSLGSKTIQAHVVRWSKARARMWEISENLHRAELTKLERAEQIEEWRKLREAEKGAKNLHPSGNTQPHDRGVSETAEELGVHRFEVQMAEKVASLTPEAKDAAREAGLDDNRSALLQVARAEPAKQVDVVREIAEHKHNRVEADVKSRAAKEVAEIMAEHVPGDLWDGLKANLYAAGAANIANALTNITGQSIMDRRFG